MFGSSVLEIAIGIVFVYLLLSLICSAVNELIESVLKNRATDLERGIRALFNQEEGGDIVYRFYNHPLISGLYHGIYKENNSAIKLKDFLLPTNLPTYIPARNFSSAVLDLILNPWENKKDTHDDSNAGEDLSRIRTNSPIYPATMANLRPNLRDLGETQLGRGLRAIAEQSGNNINLMRANLEDWFNSSMDRVSGNYKRRTQWIIFILGLILTVLLNVNTITIIKKLSTDSTARSLIVAQAEILVQHPDLRPNLESNQKQLEDLALPIGWPNGFRIVPFDSNFSLWNNVLLHLIGWLLTAGAISLGAPFWFDVLNKFMVIRSTVKPHEKSPEEDSEDRQQKPSVVQTPTPLTAAVTNSAALPEPSALPGSTTNLLPESSSGMVLTPEPDFAGGEPPVDTETMVDGCDALIEGETLDEELPPTEGGIE